MFINIISIFSIALLLFFTALTIFLLRLFTCIRNPSRKVYLVDFACYKPPEAQSTTREASVDLVRRCVKNIDEEMVEFMKKNIEKTGIGNSTYFPVSFLKDPPNFGLDEARRESEMAIFGAVDELLAKTKVKCRDIGILVVNCCIFNVTPSLSSMVVNRYKLRDNVASFSLSGMGCAAGLVAVSLAKQMLQVRHNSYALVVSTESITQNCYMGSDRSKFIINCLFRVGGAAVLLSNRPSDRRLSKYQFIHAVHTHAAGSDRSYNCILQEEDMEGHVGVTIGKDLLIVASKAIETNISSLASLVLPLSEQVRYALNYLIRHLHVADVNPYVPDFKKAVDHFFAHVGGKPVLDELQRNLGLSEEDMEASRMTLYRFGNTSSSSVWYELAYAEARGRMKGGDRVWQIAFGSGFKCCSMIWRAIRDVDREVKNPWSDEIDEFPVDTNNIPPFGYFN